MFILFTITKLGAFVQIEFKVYQVKMYVHACLNICCHLVVYKAKSCSFNVIFPPLCALSAHCLRMQAPTQSMVMEEDEKYVRIMDRRTCLSTWVSPWIFLDVSIFSHWHFLDIFHSYGIWYLQCKVHGIVTLPFKTDGASCVCKECC
jgi:hypothetical protein